MPALVLLIRLPTSNDPAKD